MPTARFPTLPLPTASILLGLLWPSLGRAQEGSRAPDFDRLVRPILSDACFQCHGPDAATRSAGLRLDQPEAVHAALPLLRERLEASAADRRMPPPEAHRQISELERGRLLEWLEAGAPWQEHWSFVPPERALPPRCRRSSDRSEPRRARAGAAMRSMPSSACGWPTRANGRPPAPSPAPCCGACSCC